MWNQLAGTSPVSAPSKRAISMPRILPENIAAEASAISSASPAAATSRPNSLALRVNSSHRVQPDGDQDGIAFEGALSPRHRVEALIYLGNGHRFNFFAPIGAQDGVRCVYRHAHACQLVAMDFIPAAFGQGFHQSDYLDSGLQGMVSGDQADIPAADDEEPLRLDAPDRD